MLDKKTIKNTLPSTDGRDVWLWDTGGVVGFYLRVKPSGKKTFGFQYRKGGDSRRVKIGDFPAFPVEEARGIAMEYSREVAKGGDPGYRVRTRRREAPGGTLEAVAKAWVVKNYTGPAGKLSKHGREVQRIFDQYVNPSFGDYAVNEVRRPELKPLIDKIADKNGGSMAHHVLRRLRTFFKAQLADDLIEADPTYGIPTPKGEKVGDRILEDWELAWVRRAIETFDYPKRDFLRLLLLCGQRREETAAMRASLIDRPTRVWKYAKSKSGAYLEQPFGDVAWEIVEPLLKAADEAGRDYLLVTPWSKGGYLQSFSETKAELDAAIATLQDEARARGEQVQSLQPWKLHDFRRAIRSNLPRWNVKEDVAELCIGHSKKGIEAVYNHYKYRDEKRAAFNTWAVHLDRLINPPEASNVRQLRA